jgi:hypothetical protein
MPSPYSDLALQRCFNHANREAAARCPSCRQYFCRECVTEHEDRVLCTACLRSLVKRGETKRSAFSMAARFGQCVLGILVAWFFFFLVGEALLRLPASFHATDLWQPSWIDAK